MPELTAMLSSPIPTWAGLAGGAAAGFVLVTVARFVHRRWWGFLPEDTPGGPRKLHARPTPMVGFLLAAVAAVWLLLSDEPAVAGAVALLAAVGYVDDRDKRRGGLPWKAKALGQLAAAAAVVAATAPRTDLGTWVWLVAFAFVVINAVNFLDNMDGVATLLGGLGVVLAARGDSALGIAGGSFLGLLPWNWPRPFLFLGDGGALPLGALLAATALRGATAADGTTAWLALLAPAFVPLLDFAQVVCARLWLGYAPWVGDRRHLTHIATYAGIPAVWVAPLCGAAAVAAWLVM